MLFRSAPRAGCLCRPADCEIAEDRRGRVIAVANHGHVPVLTPHRRLRLGPLDDVRGVAVSPDGEWLATSSHSNGDVQPLAHVRWKGGHQATDRLRRGRSIQCRWTMAAGGGPCRLWVVGTWQEAWHVGGEGLCFSADSRMLAVQDASKIVRLVETTTGRTLAALESPDMCHAWGGTFSPDGSRLAVTTREPRGAAQSGTCGPSGTSDRNGTRLGRAALFRGRPCRALGSARCPRSSSTTGDSARDRSPR